MTVAFGGSLCLVSHTHVLWAFSSFSLSPVQHIGGLLCAISKRPLQVTQLRILHNVTVNEVNEAYGVGVITGRVDWLLVYRQVEPPLIYIPMETSIRWS